jgi:hypothetical protein
MLLGIDMWRAFVDIIQHNLSNLQHRQNKHTKKDVVITQNRTRVIISAVTPKGEN